MSSQDSYVCKWRRPPKISSSRTWITKTSTSKSSTVENIDCQKWRLTKTSIANKINIKLKTSHNRGLLYFFILVRQLKIEFKSKTETWKYEVMDGTFFFV